MLPYNYDLKVDELNKLKSVKRVLVWKYDDALQRIDSISNTLFIIGVLPATNLFLTFIHHSIVDNQALIEFFVWLNLFAILGYFARKRSLGIALLGLTGFVVWIISLWRWRTVFQELIRDFDKLILVIGFVIGLILLLMKLLQGIYSFWVAKRAKREIIDVLNRRLNIKNL